MKLSRTHYYAAGLLVLLMVLPSWAQKTGSSGSQAPKPQPGGAGSSGQPTGTSQPSNPRMQTPLYIKGRVIMNTGEPVPEPVSVGLNCGMRLLQAIHTDAKGYFEFVLGAGPQGNVDMSASNDTIGRADGNTSFSGGFGGVGGFGGDPGNRVMGCELQVSVTGYEPLIKTITDPGDVTGIEAGTLQLRRLAGVEGSSISVTSLQVPNSARKEFDKATSDVRSNHVASATQHLEKALSIYDKYAAAWNQLGLIYTSSHQMDEASKAFAKAIDSDPKYIPPYMGLAALQLQDEKYNDAVETAGKALALDPRLGVASFIQAAASLRLNRLDDAEKSARKAEQGPHQNFPQVHVVLAQIFVQKHDEANAAAEMRAYLKEAPQGNFAAEIKKSLEEIERSTATADGTSTASPGPPQIAP